MTSDTLPYQPRQHVQRDPDALAFKMCDSGETVSFGELEAKANQGAHLLRSIGINIGDHVAILLENRREFLEICFAADRAGVFYTTISTHLTSEEIAYILNDCDARILITSKKFCKTLDALKSKLEPDCQIYLVGSCEDSFNDNGARIANWNQSLQSQPESPIDDEMQGFDMLYSSGTTGKPKGVKWQLTGCKPGEKTMLIDLLTSLYGYDRETRYLCPAPLYHAAPLRHSMVTIKAGGSVFIMPRFDPEEALSLIDMENITHSQWVPTMFVRILKLPDEILKKYDLSSMKVAVHAAAPCPVDVKHKMIDWWGAIIYEYYSGTENNGFTSITTQEWLNHQGSVGKAKLGKIHICDDEGNELPVGQEGEVYFENGHQFEYHKDIEKTRASRNQHGWTTLGDIGRVDEDGFLYLTDRKSFVIISGGVNIYPQEAEDILLGHPAVLDAAVIGVPNIDYGEEVRAIVQLMPGHSGSEELEAELIALTHARLSKIKCPRSVEFRDALPRSATGKLYKQKLKEEFWNRTSGLIGETI